MSNIRGEPIYRAHPSQGKGRLQIAVGLKSELPFEIVLGEPRGSGVTRQKYPSEGAAIGGPPSVIWLGSTGNGKNPMFNGRRQPSRGGTSRMTESVKSGSVRGSG
jgi:hypothetical protein